MDNDALILWMEDKFTALNVRISDIDKNIVGQDKCEDYRKEGTSHCRAVNTKFNTRLCRIEEIAFGYEATKDQSVSIEAIQAAVDNALKVRAVDLTWDTVRNNTVLKAVCMALALSVSLPALGRWNEGVAAYGLHSMLIGAGIFLGGLILLWAFMNRAATKKVLKL